MTPALDAPSQDYVARADLGDWPHSADETAFALFRATELYRGALQVRYAADPKPRAQLEKDGSLILSTGLLDAIDARLFDALAASPRRSRNFEEERESALAPYIAEVAATYALEGAPAAIDRQSMDRMALFLLRQAGYDERGYADWLAADPEKAARRKALSASAETTARFLRECDALFAAAVAGSHESEIQTSYLALQGIVGESRYLTRLRAIALHRAFLLSLSPADVPLAPILPGANSPSDPRLIAPWLDRALNLPVTRSPARSVSNLLPSRSAELRRASLDSYALAMTGLPDHALDSGHASLLAYGPDPVDQSRALELAMNAAEAEESSGSSSPCARVTLASLLYAKGTHYARAELLFERFALKAGLEEPGDRVSEGFPCDSRAIAINLAIVAKARGKSEKANAVLSRCKPLVSTDSDPGLVSLRRIVPGSSVDELMTRWGKPSGISYDYFNEYWDYPSLKARALVDKDSSGSERVAAVFLKPGSPVSPAGNVRLGDPIADLENILGKPVFLGSDCRVYRSGGILVWVQGPSTRIRSIAVTR